MAGDFFPEWKIRTKKILLKCSEIYILIRNRKQITSTPEYTVLCKLRFAVKFFAKLVKEKNTKTKFDILSYLNVKNRNSIILLFLKEEWTQEQTVFGYPTFES